MSRNSERAGLVETESQREAYLRDMVAGLSLAHNKQIPCKYFYDERGSELFEQICELDEYYLTRCELEILETHGAEIGDCVGRAARLIEYGCGSSRKIRMLLSDLHDPVAYIPVDIAEEALEATAEEVRRAYPQMFVQPVCTDFTVPFPVPQGPRPAERNVAYFSGSTIGNFSREKACELLRSIALTVGADGGLLIAADLKKDREILEAAYDDAEGVTAEFNLNLLHRANRELGANFNVDKFRHRAVYDEFAGRIEMQLVSEADQEVELGGTVIRFEAGEVICTEYSHKYSADEFTEMARLSGFETEAVWTDELDRFAIFSLRVANGPQQ